MPAHERPRRPAQRPQQPAVRRVARAREHAQRIAAVNPAAKVVIIPNVDHEGFVAKTGGRDEVPLLDRIPPRAIEPTIDWILALR